MRPMRATTFAVALTLTSFGTGCHSTAAEVVRSLAATDYACPEDKVHVTPAREKGVYRADGCGKTGTYACEGWDSYNQKPVCASAR